MRILLISALALLSGCSTIVKGTSQAVSVATPNVSGAKCELSSPAIGTVSVVTPATITLEKSQHNVQVRCKKDCYADGVGVINSNTELMAAGNVILGGPIGLAIDAGSGAMNNYTPTVQIAMTPLRGCRGGVS